MSSEAATLKSVRAVLPPTNIETAVIEVIHTLGPEGTNLAAAAGEWFRRQGREGRTILHRTVEEAVDSMPKSSGHGLLTCAVYPDLHNIVFRNLARLRFVDSFIWPTLPMLLASRDGSWPSVVSTHPAPRSLVPEGLDIVLTTSNSQAAADCAESKTDGCITTAAAAEKHGLKIIHDFGPVPMVFTLHGQPTLIPVVHAIS